VRRLTPAKLAVIVVLVSGLSWYSFQVMRPPLPVTVQFRSGVDESRFALTFLNQSDLPLAFTATLQHPGQRDKRTFAVQVQPHATYELGSSQGWAGQSGDRIWLSGSNFKVWRGAIP
jgi:hypothetical protein